MSTDLSGRRAISAMQSPIKISSNGSSRFGLVLERGRKAPSVSAMRAIRFMRLPPLRRKVSQARLAVKRTEVNALFEAPRNEESPRRLSHKMLSPLGLGGLNLWWCDSKDSRPRFQEAPVPAGRLLPSSHVRDRSF